MLPCEDGGRPNASGRCDACRYRHAAGELLAEAELLAAAALDPADISGIAWAVGDVREILGTLTAEAHQRFLDAHEPGGAEGERDEIRDLVAYNELDILQQVVPQIRTSTLKALAAGPEADAEAGRARATKRGRRCYQARPEGADALAAADDAAQGPGPEAATAA